ncbi:MAG: aspartate aminotransferase family protein, partial [Candidatus Kapaibacterium sp.]
MGTVIDMEKKHIFQTYKRFPLEIERAEGCYIYSKDGREYLDFLGGIAVNALGHTHPRVKKAVCDQVGRYMHVSNYFYQQPQSLLAQKLCRMTGYDRVFFSNSGAESIEGIIKLVRRWGHAMSKTKIVAFTGGFHGRTYGALSLMDKPHYKDKMGPFLPNIQVLR